MQKRNPTLRPRQAFNSGMSGAWTALVNLLDVVFGSLQRVIGIRGMAYFFVLPNLLIFGVFILFPMLSNFAYTFTSGDELFLHNRPISDPVTHNFQRLVTCESYLDVNTCTEDIFIRSLRNTAFFVVTQVAWMVLFSLATAIVLNQNIVARGFFRSVFFYPVLLSPIVVGLLWRWILQENGALNAVLIALGGDKMDFLTISEWSRLWVVIISIWSLTGFYTLILLAGLQSIPSDLYEAASMDGANSWKSFRSITLPLLMPTMLVVIVLATIRAVQIFDVVWAFNGGGPGTATTFIVQYIYNNIVGSTKEYGLAATASLIMASILIVFTLLQLRLRGRDDLA